MTYVPVHNHTEYSTLDGESTTDEAARRAAETGSPALAITDHGNCFGHVQHQRSCAAAGVSPIFGIETYFRPDRFQRPAEGDAEAKKRLINGEHLVLLARSDKGLHDLWAASTEAYATGFYGRPRMDWDLLEERGSDLIATTACLGGIIAKDVQARNVGAVAAKLGRLKSIFRDRLYLEIQGNELPEQIRMNRLLAEVSEAMDIPLVAACDAHYPSPAETELHRIWMLCQSGGGKEDYWNFCVAPETKVLNDRLQWVRADSLAVGGGLLGFDENPGDAKVLGYKRLGRRYKHSVVESNEVIERPCYELEFDDSTTVRCSAEHMWLITNGGGTARWATTESLWCGPRYFANVIKPLSVWEQRDDRDAGYLAAAFDGEGSISQRTGERVSSLAVVETVLSFAQRENSMLREVTRILRENGFKYWGDQHRSNGVHNLRISRRSEILRLLGTFQPLRLLDNFDPDKLGLMPCNPTVKLVRKTFIGTQKVIALRTSSRTFFAEGLASHNSPMLTEQALRESLGYLDPKAVDRAIWSTHEIAEQCTARIGGHAELPVFTPGGTADDDAVTLRAMCEANWSLVAHLGREYRERLDYEFEIAVVQKHLAGCYLIVEDLIRFARSQGYLVGPGRGSAAGSLISYLIGITSVDPIRSGLLFERFLTPGRESLPDFDLDFQSSARGPLQDYAVERYGSDHVVRVGTVMRYGTKGIINKLATVYKDRYSDEVVADAKLIGKLVDQAEAGTAGLGLPWEEIVQEPEIAGFGEKYPELFATAAKLVGRVYAQGQHPAGLIISPGRVLTGTIPMRHVKPGDKLLVSQWDYRAADDLNLLKLDLLTLRTLDSIAEAIRLVEKRTGIRLDPRSWDIEHLDPQVYDAIDTGQTLGVFQLETSLCSEYSRRMKPRTLADLADLTTFIRPGPRNSGATEKYLKRRAGTEPVTYPHPLLEEALAQSYGLMLYQEHVLLACKVLAGYSDLEADNVRKILGKKLVSKIEAAGEEFVSRAVERGHDEEGMRALWADIAEFGRYAFNKAHGFSYGVLSYWTAWLKEHYPVEFLTAVMSTVDMDRLPEFAMEARRIGITVQPPDVRFCKGGFTCEGIQLRYGLLAIPKVGEAAVKKITAAQPFESYADFLTRSGVDAGVLYALARAGALDALVPSRRGLIQAIEADRDGSSVRCVHKTDPDDPLSWNYGLPCSFDWDADRAGQEDAYRALMAPRIAAGRKPLKFAPKLPPAKCTRACRHYTPPRLASMDAWEEYPADALFRSDMLAYGTWMSGRIFGRLDDFSPGLREKAAVMARALVTAGPGTYPVAAVVADVHSALTKKGSAMWWVTLLTEVSELNLACFSPRRDDELDVPAMVRGLLPGTLVEASIRKHPYQSKSGPRMGWNLMAIYPLGA